MFPWLPFLTFPEGGSGPRSLRRNRKHASLGSVWLNVDFGDVRIEYLPSAHLLASSASVTAASSSSEVANEQYRPDSAPLGDVIPHESREPQKKRSLQSSRPVTPGSTSRASPRSASASNSRPSSRPSSAAPPPQPRIRPNRGRMFETSAAMLEIFGASTSSTRQPVVEPSTNSFQDNNPASVCFQSVPSPPTERLHFGRTSTLQREGMQKTEWEPIPSTSTSNVSTFQTVPDHNAVYEQARRRGNWETSNSSFNVVNQLTEREIPVSNIIMQEDGQPCPAEEVLRQRNRLRSEERRFVGEMEDENMDETGVKDIEEENISGGGSSIKANGCLPNGTASIGRFRGPGEGEGSSSNAQRENEERERALPLVSPHSHQTEQPNTPHHSSPSVSPKVVSADSPLLNDENLEPIPLASKQNKPQAQKNGQVPKENGSHRLNGAETLQKLRRLILACSEDGSGMVSASGSGAGAGINPILIKNAQIVNDDAIFSGDVLIEDGVIKQILSGLEAPENAEQIDAAGRLLLPAGIDVHTEFLSGTSPDQLADNTKAALAGGTATIIDVVNITADTESLISAVDRSQTLIEAKAQCNVGLAVPLFKWTDGIKAQVENLCRDKGVNSFILELDKDSELCEALDHLKKLGALARVFPEKTDVISWLEKKFSSLGPSNAYVEARPAKLEAGRIHDVCEFSHLTNAPFTVLSTSSSEACRAVQSGRQEGALVFAEIPITALAPENVLNNTQSRIPIRNGQESAKDALELLANGPLSVCVSDHRIPRILPNKPSIGAISAGERLPMLWEKAVATGQIDLMRFVAVTSTNPAKLFNLYPRKGRIAVGADADLVLWNVQSTKSLGCKAATGVDRSVFDGFTVHSVPEITICAGRVAYKNGKFEDNKPLSAIPLPVNAPHVFSVVQLREKTLNLAKPAERKESNVSTASNKPSNTQNTRPSTRGQNNELASNQRSGTKVIHPPGGRSTGLW